MELLARDFKITVILVVLLALLLPASTYASGPKVSSRVQQWSVSLDGSPSGGSAPPLTVPCNRPVKGSRCAVNCPHPRFTVCGFVNAWTGEWVKLKAVIYGFNPRPIGLSNRYQALIVDATIRRTVARCTRGHTCRAKVKYSKARTDVFEAWLKDTHTGKYPTHSHDLVVSWHSWKHWSIRLQARSPGGSGSSTQFVTARGNPVELLAVVTPRTNRDQQFYIYDKTGKAVSPAGRSFGCSTLMPAGSCQSVVQESSPTTHVYQAALCPGGKPTVAPSGNLVFSCPKPKFIGNQATVTWT